MGNGFGFCSPSFETRASPALQDEDRTRLNAAEQQGRIAFEDFLAIGAERLQLIDELLYARSIADLLRIVGAEDAARRRQFQKRRLNRLDLAAHAGGVEHQP